MQRLSVRFRSDCPECPSRYTLLVRDAENDSEYVHKQTFSDRGRARVPRSRRAVPSARLEIARPRPGVKSAGKPGGRVAEYGGRARSPTHTPVRVQYSPVPPCVCAGVWTRTEKEFYPILVFNSPRESTQSYIRVCSAARCARGETPPPPQLYYPLDTVGLM